MAYKYIARYSCVDRAAALTKIWSMLSDMGWTLEDNQDGSSYRIYSSDSEAEDRIKEYMQFRWDTDDQINFRAWYRWNGGSITAGQASAYYIASTHRVLTSEDGFYLWMHGNKNMFIITTRIANLYYQSGGGHLPTRMINVIAEFQNAESSGSNVEVEVDDVTGFIPGATYMVVGSNNEGRFWVTVDAVSDPDPYNAGTLTIASLNTNYAAGTLIGQSPSTFGVYREGIQYLDMTCTTNTSYDVLTDITHSTAYANRFDVFSNTYRDPDYRTGLYTFAPFGYVSNDINISNSSLFAYSDSFVLSCAIVDNEDIFTFNDKDTGTATAASTDSTLTDSGKSWTVNEHSGRAVVITFGIGVGQIRKIVSNTATVLTLDFAWQDPIGTDTEYTICESAYRYIDHNSVLREGY